MSCPPPKLTDLLRLCYNIISSYASKFFVFETEQPGTLDVQLDLDDRQRLVGGEVALCVPAAVKRTLNIIAHVGDHFLGAVGVKATTSHDKRSLTFLNYKF